MSGFVVIRREALEHHVIGDPERFYAWCWLISNACWKPSRIKIKGETVSLDRGELSFSVRFLAERWGWSKSRVDRFIAELRAEGMITTRSKIGTTAGHKAGQGQSILTICNYAKYQDVPDRQRDNREPESGTTAGQQRDKEEPSNQYIPLSNDNGSPDFSDDPDKAFWRSARGYLGPSKASLVGKLSGQYGREAVAEAITVSMLQRPQPPDPVSYVIGILKKRRSPQPMVPL